MDYILIFTYVKDGILRMGTAASVKVALTLLLYSHIISEVITLNNTKWRDCMEQKEEKGYTPYQQKVIRRFYENKDLRLIQKLGELVSNLYVETNEKSGNRMEENKGNTY